MELYEVIIAVIVTFALTVLLCLFFFNCSTGEKEIKYGLEPTFRVGDEQFQRVIGELLGPPLLEGNRIDVLLNGDEIFPAMLEAIRGARRSVCFETYIYWSGEIGRQFSDALSERARAGIPVHVLLDWAGCARIDQGYLRDMKDAGVQVEQFHPLRWYHLSRLNNRTHRKLLVVDGEIGFTGGVGIAPKWTGNAQDEEHWRDTHFRLTGPTVAQMQAAFLDNWIKVRSCVLHDERYFPPLKSAGSMKAQVFKSSRDEGSESVRLMYLMSIAAARDSIRLSAAYFVPDDLALRELVEACQRGVRIEIVVPGEIIDSDVVRKASRACWGDLLEAGVKIYEYQRTMFHCKVLIVDDVWVSVGSTNFDNRSFRLNAEANLNVLDREFAQEQIRIFNEDKMHSRLMTCERYHARPRKERVQEWFAQLLRSQL